MAKKMNGKEIYAEMQRLCDVRDEMVKECQPIINMYYKLCDAVGSSNEHLLWNSLGFARKYDLEEEWRAYSSVKNKLKKAVDEYKDFIKAHPRIYDKWYWDNEQKKKDAA